jgi:hypothetical protein
MMKTRINLGFLFIIFITNMVLAQANLVRIPLASSDYSAQLRGITATRTAGLTIQGSYNGTSEMFEFSITVSGRYDLYYDPAGGSSYVKDTNWSGANGRWVPASVDIEEALTFAETDSNIVPSKLSPEVHALINSGGEGIGEILAGEGIDVTSGTGPITTITVESIFKNFVNPLRFGADSSGGSSSSQAFQNAFNHADTAGYSGVLVSSGTYLVKNVRIPAGMILIAAGATFDVFGASNPSPLNRLDTTDAMFHFYGATAADKARGLKVIGGYYIGVKNLTYVEELVSQPDIFNVWNADKVSFENVVILNTQRSGIIARNASNLEVKHSTFKFIAGPALYLVGGKNVVVEADSFNTVGHAMRVHPDTANSRDAENIEFRLNHVEAVKTAIKATAPKDLSITKNFFTPAAVSGFDGDSAGAVWISRAINSGENAIENIVKNLTIFNNTIEDYDDMATAAGDPGAIDIRSTSSMTAEGINIAYNRIGNCDRSIYADVGISFYNNEVRAMSDGGISNCYFGTTVANYQVDIKDNEFDRADVVSGYDALETAGSSFFQIEDNYSDKGDLVANATASYEGKITGNVIQGAQLYVGFSGSIISGNNIQYDLAAGLRVDGDNNHITNNFVNVTGSFECIFIHLASTGNTVFSNRTEGGTVGIYVESSDNHKISLNQCQNASGFPIHLDGGGGADAENCFVMHNFVDGTVQDDGVSNTVCYNVTIP